MIFYLGTHRLKLCLEFPHSFVSVNILRKRRSDFLANAWILDSGAFTELARFGEYLHSVEDYALQINRWKTCGNLEMAVCQDYMCEPFMLERTGLTIKEHQRLTIERYRKLFPLTDLPILPVLQGYSVSDYLRHLDDYGDNIIQGMRVGVGSVCKRNAKPRDVMVILEAIKRERPDLRLHAFGLKITALRSNYILSLLHSADSMAWSYRARREGRDANSLEEARSFYNDISTRAGNKPTQLLLQEGE